MTGRTISSARKSDRRVAHAIRSRTLHRLNVAALLVVLLAQAAAAQQVITTVAGGGPNNVPAVQAPLANPLGVAVDALGRVFIASSAANRVYRVDASGVLTIVAGYGERRFAGDGGPAVNAAFYDPYGIAIDATGNLFIADGGNNRIRKVDGSSGLVTTVAGTGTPGYGGDGGPATSAVLGFFPAHVAVDGVGNLFISDSANHRVRKVDAASGTITTVVGTGGAGFSGDGGPATAAAVFLPQSIAVDNSGNLFVNDAGNRRIRKVSAATGTITTVAGTGATGSTGDGGPATAAAVSTYGEIETDTAGNLFIVDASSVRVRKVDASTGIIASVAGSGVQGFTGDGGPATSASLREPLGLAIDGAGNLFISDVSNQRIRRVDGSSGIITTLAGNGRVFLGADGVPATSSEVHEPLSVALDAAGNIFIGESGANVIRKVDALSGLITTVAGNGTGGFGGDGGPATDAKLGGNGSGVAVDTAGNVFIADQNNHRIRRVDAASGIISTVAGDGNGGFNGDGIATSASLYSPLGLAIDATGDVYITDNQNHRIRRLEASSGVLTTVAGDGNYGFGGDGGPATSASLAYPLAVAVDGAGNLYIVDSDNNRIRRVAASTGVITTLAGTGTAGFSGDGGPATSATLNVPIGVAVDSAGNVFIADTDNERVRMVEASTGTITTVAGVGTAGFGGDGGAPLLAAFSGLAQLAVDAAGAVYIADQRNHRIRHVTAPQNTPEGSDVVVETAVTGPGGASTAISITFEEVVSGGTTSIMPGEEGPPPPSGFKLTDPPVVYEVETTATFSGPVTLCFVWEEGEIDNEQQARLFHYEGGWVDVTVPGSLDVTANRICGSVANLSPFAILQPDYVFDGFFAPVDNPPTLNKVNAGRAIPVKFSLGADFGLDILATGSPMSQTIACDSSAPIGVIAETVTAGASSLAYTGGHYTYVWKTDLSWANTCRQLTIRLADGTSRVASFKFAK